MTKTNADFLIELGVEELPSRSLLPLQEKFSQCLQTEIEKTGLHYEKMKFFISPRRIAGLVSGLDNIQTNRIQEKIGPAINIAYDEHGEPTSAARGFAKSCGTTIDQLQIKDTPKGRCICYVEEVKGKSSFELLPDIVSTAINNIHIAKPMRWGSHNIKFIRPVRWITMMLDDQVINAKILEIETGNLTYGHRFLCANTLPLQHANTYEQTLKTAGFVIPNYQERKKLIREQLHAISTSECDVAIDEELLEEVTGLVEWPRALRGTFDPRFLQLPTEVLISSMKTHQRYFPLLNQKGQIEPFFVTVSNIESTQPQEVINGNERVLRARLVDAEFFFHTDVKHSMNTHLEKLKDIIFQTKLGTMYEKATRIAELSKHIATLLNENKDLAFRAGLLSKADLTTEMVGEFPELQGVMGYYYALKDNEPELVALAIKEHYQPRFAKDFLPQSTLGSIVSLADKLDTLLGIFAIGQAPTGEKDPFGLRRAALGVLRIIIEREYSLDLKTLLEFLSSLFKTLDIKDEDIQQTLDFILERLRAWYSDQGIATEIFSAVYARFPTNPKDFDSRIRAVQHFLQLPDAQALSAANKRVSNILKQNDLTPAHTNVNYNLLQEDAERELVNQLEQKTKIVEHLCAERRYQEALATLSTLRETVDRFFDEVMVMVEDQHLKMNRLILLNNLRNLFLQIADISFLQ